MKGFDKVLQAVREGKEFYHQIGGQGFSIADVKDHKVSPEPVDYFLRNAKARVRKRNPIAPNQADYVMWPLYDRISYAAAATVPNLSKLFVQPIGTNNKTQVDTNLSQVSVLEAPQWFNVMGLSMYFNPNVAPIDLANYLATEYINFWVSQKVYATGPIDIFPSSGGMYNSTSLGTMGAAATSYITTSTNGWPSAHNMYDVRLPAGLPLGQAVSWNGQTSTVTADGIIGITILQSQTFRIDLNADGGGATMAANNAVPIAGVGITVSCRLHGILSRGVQ